MNGIVGFLLVNIYAFIVILSICIIFFRKKRLKKMEDETYAKFLITNVFLSVSGLLLGFLVIPEINSSKILIMICNKLYLISIFFWTYYLTFYTYFISTKHKEKLEKRIKLFKTIKYIMLITIIILPNYVTMTENGAIASGPALMITYLACVIGIIIQIVCILLRHNFLNKKYIPVYIMLLLGPIVFVVMMINPELNYIVNPTLIFVCFIMYHTIENPDVKMIEQLNIAKDIADKANNAKTEFLSSMSHEVRTPLNAIMGFSESLKEENLSAKAQEEVNDIISASNSLLEIVNGILDISKIEANKLEIIDNEYDIYKMINELKNLTKARIGAKDVELKVNIDKTLPQVLYGDEIRLKQIILNLLTNAAKYTDKGQIEFNINCVFNQDICRLIISVKDTGRGIKEENINKLFTKFERLDEKNSTIEGTGLGLAITKKLVDLMQGKIVVQSKVNVGSNFMVSIDQKIVANPTLKIEKETIIQEEITNNYKDKKILIVDDNLLNLKVAVRLLEPYEMNIEEADNGDDAINKVKQNLYYDLILLDDMMPHKSGGETLEELKQIPNFNIPVVVLTANAIEGMKEKYLEMGFDDYLAKPIIKDELKRVLQKYLNK